MAFSPRRQRASIPRSTRSKPPCHWRRGCVRSIDTPRPPGPDTRWVNTYEAIVLAQHHLPVGGGNRHGGLQERQSPCLPGPTPTRPKGTFGPGVATELGKSGTGLRVPAVAPAPPFPSTELGPWTLDRRRVPSHRP